MNEYRSVLNEASGEITEKKSRFICSVKPVNTEHEAMEFIKKISDAYRDATHNVFAYVVMDGVEVQRASDDGEPQGTAGIPVLEVIKKEGLKNVCVVVTRYFGGILLGAGGLIRAYSAAAKKGIYESGICTKALYRKLSVKISYPYLGKVQNIISSLGNDIMTIEYTQLVTIYIKVMHDKVDATVREITDVTGGEAEINSLESFYDVIREK